MLKLSVADEPELVECLQKAVEGCLRKESTKQACRRRHCEQDPNTALEGNSEGSMNSMTDVDSYRASLIDSETAARGSEYSFPQ